MLESRSSMGNLIIMSMSPSNSTLYMGQMSLLDLTHHCEMTKIQLCGGILLIFLLHSVHM
jgi:hypothetical protein